MIMAGTPCPYKGKIGKDAHIAWGENPRDVPFGSQYYVKTPPPPPPEPEIKVEKKKTNLDLLLGKAKEKRKAPPAWCTVQYNYSRGGGGQHSDPRCNP